MGMWAMVIFVLVHIYAAVREDILSREAIITSMISGWRKARKVTRRIRTPEAGRKAG
jgi:Ni/Fe-hydrogenase 1 B-type cytochrome subunit